MCANVVDFEIYQLTDAACERVGVLEACYGGPLHRGC